MNNEDNKMIMGNIREILTNIKESKMNATYITPEMIPDIDLYMDQVTTFMDTHLERSKRYKEDKILTKTMINNYAKNDLLPPPDKKKYSKDHLLLLTFIYYFKNILSMNDIQTLLFPLKENYFKTTDNKPLTDIYTEVFDMSKGHLNEIMEDIEAKFNLSKLTFKDSKPTEKDTLNAFSFICILIYDIYLKKQLVEQIIDQINSDGRDNKTDQDKKSRK